MSFGFRVLSFLTPLFFFLAGEISSASYRFQCSNLFSKHYNREKSWAALHNSGLSQQFTWLDRPLEESVRDLPLFKRWRLKWLLKWSQPEVDFLNAYQAENFIHEVFEIFEGPAKINPYNATSSRAYLTRTAFEGIGKRSLMQMAQSMRPDDPGFSFRFRRRISQIFGAPIMSFFALPIKLPYMSDQQLADQMIDSLLERKSVQTLDLFESILIQGRITRSQYLQMRIYGNRLLLGATAVLLSMQLQHIHDYSQIKAEESGQATLKAHQEKKAAEFERESKNLDALENQQRRMQESPVEYMEEFLLKEFTRQQGKAPTPQQKIRIRRIAEEMAKK